jgi:hypothetical protein
MVGYIVINIYIGRRILIMSTKFSNKKLIHSLLLFVAFLVCTYFVVFNQASQTPNRNRFFFILGIPLGRFAVLLYKRSIRKE